MSLVREILQSFSPSKIYKKLFSEQKLNEAENELEVTQLNQKIKNLKEQRETQNELIRKYKVEIAELEHELAVIRENVKSLDERCQKRTQLEP
jgi:septation ring formation regulator EzrA